MALAVIGMLFRLATDFKTFITLYPSIFAILISSRISAGLFASACSMPSTPVWAVSYQVNDELIGRVAKGNWNPEEDAKDKGDRDAMAARGYFQAFHDVKVSIAAILSGENAGEIARKAHHHWYGELFAPSVTAGIVEPHQLAGYRSGPIFIRNSMHTPLPREALADAMEMLFNLIAQEPEPAVRAVLGHHLFVFIHPYFDGNGRIGRFLMNTMLASGGYPWTIIRVKSRAQYMSALEQASVGGDIKPFAEFIVQEMQAWES